MKAIKIFRVALLGSVALFLGSCAEEVEVEKPQEGEQVNISISVHQDWDDDEATRAARMEKSDFAGPREAVQFDGTIGGQPVYIWCDELDGIDDGLSPLTAEAPELDDETRGTLMTATGTGAASDDMSMFHRDFSIWNCGVNLIPNNTKAERPWSSNRWRLNNKFTWQSNAGYVCAIAPYGAPYTSVHVNNWHFYYETPEKAVDQPDLMACYTYVSKTDAEMVFPFRHVLSAIRFKMGSKGFAGGYTIKNIELRGVKTEGRFNITDANFSWLVLANTRNINPNQDFNFPITDATYNTMITNDGTATTTGTTFLLIPQSTSVTCAIKLQDAGGQEKTITASLPATIWRAGYTYTYTIASEVDNSDFILNVSGEPVFNYQGTYEGGGASATNQYGIQSYRITSQGISKPVAWEIVKYEYSDDGGTTWIETGNGGKDKPAWLTGLSLESGAGSMSWHYGRVTGLNSSDYIVDKTAERNAKFKTTPVSDYDLSRYDIKGIPWPNGRNTANCYIISAPGSYKIPLVYGNAIKDDQPNPSAYNYNNMLNLAWNTVREVRSGKSWRVQYTDVTTTTDWCRSHNAIIETSTTGGDYYYTRTGPQFDQCDLVYENPFVDYSGTPITDPWLKENGANGTPKTAAVQWTSGSSHIPTNLAINGDYLTFDVPAANLRAGNSQIVVKDESGKIMWSWHLWFAPDDVLDDTEVTNYDGVTYKFAKETLGFTPGTWVQTTYNEPRKIRVTVQQKEGSGGSLKTAPIYITQKNGGSIAQAHAPVYQWGKKDPFLASSSGIVGTTATIDQYSSSIQLTILSPYVFYANYSNYRDSESSRTTTGLYLKECKYGSAFGPGGNFPMHNYETIYEQRWQNCPYPRRYDSYKGYYFTNLWNANTNNLNIVHERNEPVVKTVYDPCPAGFHIPPSNAHSGFSLSGYSDLEEYAYNYPGTSGGLNGQSLGSNMWQLYSYGYRDASEAERKNSRVLTYFIGNYLANSNAPMAWVNYANSTNYMQNSQAARVDNPIVSSTSGTYYMRLNTGMSHSFRIGNASLSNSSADGCYVVPVKD